MKNVDIVCARETAAHGLGWIDRIPDRAIYGRSRSESLRQLSQELAGEFDGQTPGRPHWLPDGRIGKFGWKAQFATLEEFVAAACANEVGLGTPSSKQGRPLAFPGYPDQKPDLNRDQLAREEHILYIPGAQVFRIRAEQGLPPLPLPHMDADFLQSRMHGICVGEIEAMEGAGRTVCDFEDVPWEFTMDFTDACTGIRFSSQ